MTERLVNNLQIWIALSPVQFPLFRSCTYLNLAESYKCRATIRYLNCWRTMLTQPSWLWRLCYLYGTRYALMHRWAELLICLDLRGCCWLIRIFPPWQHTASTWTIHAFQDWALALPGLWGQLRAGRCGFIVEVLQVLKEGGGEDLQPGILFQQLESGSVQVLQYTPGQCKHTYMVNGQRTWHYAHYISKTGCKSGKLW